MSCFATFETLTILLVFFFLSKGSAAVKPELHPKTEEIIKNEGESFEIVCTSSSNIFFSYPVDMPDEGITTSTPEITEDEDAGVYRYTFRRMEAICGDTGWYGCADHYFESTIDEYSNPNISWVYVYVRSQQYFFVQEEIIPSIRVVQYNDTIIPCRPTSPDDKTVLEDSVQSMEDDGRVSFDPKIGFIIRNVTLTDGGYYTCGITRFNVTQKVSYTMLVYRNVELPKPKIQTEPLHHVIRGQVLRVNCTILLDKDITQYVFNWSTPQQSDRITSRHYSAAQGNVREVVSELTIDDVRDEDEGRYICRIQAPFSDVNSDVTYLAVHDPDVKHINLTSASQDNVSQRKIGDRIQWVVNVDAYPQPRYKWTGPREGEILGNWADPENTKYAIKYTLSTIILRINHLNINDMGNYTLQAENGGNVESLNFTLQVITKPVPIIVDRPLAYYSPMQMVEITCLVGAFPEPNISWWFLECPNYPSREHSRPIDLTYTKGTWEKTKFETTVNFSIAMSGQLTCKACNALGCDWATENILVSDGNGGFGVIEPKQMITTGDNVELICAASVYNYTNKLEWVDENNDPINPDERIAIRRNQTAFTYRSILTISNVRKSDSKVYICDGMPLDAASSSESVYYKLDVQDSAAPYFSDTNMNRSEIVVDLGTEESHKTMIMKCFAGGMPEPTVTWYKDGVRLEDNEQYFFLYRQQELHIRYLLEKDNGKYVCRAENRLGIMENYQLITIKAKEIPKALVASIVILGLVVVGLAIFFAVRIRRERRIRKELMETGLMHFAEGAVECLNPDLTVDDQAELLPYDNKWEFPRDRLKIGMQLGSGAFGVVAKAEAQGICENEAVTTVAVKMVRHTTDPTYVRALASELKIMVHLGKHLNVVNLLGACTKNIYKRELLVIVEYCRYGNLHNYLLRHRKNFVNQIDPSTGKFDPAIGIEQLSRSFSISSSSNNRIKYAALSFSRSLSVNSDSAITPGTDSQCVPLSPNDSCVLSNNSIQPGWRSNYRGDYKDHNLKPICTQDLLSWAFQVARGMEYLSQRRVLHGDLAARNILLAENNIVKICDFGLAKTMYKDDNYKKKADGPLPIKWMAIESIRDRIFSTQSDIWSFGIVLWEFFTLAETPYPGIEAEKLYPKLIEGYRMEQPEYATKEVYEIMRQCWKAKPSLRPSFTELVNDIGNLLEETVRSHYVSLNDPYIDMNTMILGEGKSDYLTMMSSPDHAALSSPTANNYANTSVAGVSVDGADNDPSYLCMSPGGRSRATDVSEIFSPRPVPEDTCFDFPSPASDSEDAVEMSPMLQKTEEDPYLKPVDVNERRAEFARRRQAAKLAGNNWTASDGQFDRDSGYCNALRTHRLIDLNEQEKQSVLDINDDDGDNDKDGKPSNTGYSPTIISTADNYVNMPRHKNDLKKEMPGGFSNPSYAMITDKDVVQTRV